jgi:hypothetical protein
MKRNSHPYVKASCQLPRIALTFTGHVCTLHRATIFGSTVR